jgi:hypothetical protein
MPAARLGFHDYDVTIRRYHGDHPGLAISDFTIGRSGGGPGLGGPGLPTEAFYPPPMLDRPGASF